MKAITQKRYGGPEVLEYSEVPVPTPKPDQVLIRVRAASVNAADWLLTRTWCDSSSDCARRRRRHPDGMSREWLQRSAAR